ncbi:hypothetical protein BC829DRAFT_225255 [Chytridium lagenaria]|nr:hypothetical protein BC829DRAFT_225255 [Chytridium lagenaria]
MAYGSSCSSPHSRSWHAVDIALLLDKMEEVIVWNGSWFSRWAAAVAFSELGIRVMGAQIGVSWKTKEREEGDMIENIIEFLLGWAEKGGEEIKSAYAVFPVDLCSDYLMRMEPPRDDLVTKLTVFKDRWIPSITSIDTKTSLHASNVAVSADCNIDAEDVSKFTEADDLALMDELFDDLSESESLPQEFPEAQVLLNAFQRHLSSLNINDASVSFLDLCRSYPTSTSRRQAFNKLCCQKSAATLLDAFVLHGLTGDMLSWTDLIKAVSLSDAATVQRILSLETDNTLSSSPNDSEWDDIFKEWPTALHPIHYLSKLTRLAKTQVDIKPLPCAVLLSALWQAGNEASDIEIVEHLLQKLAQYGVHDVSDLILADPGCFMPDIGFYRMVNRNASTNVLEYFLREEVVKFSGRAGMLLDEVVKGCKPERATVLVKAVLEVYIGK